MCIFCLSVKKCEEATVLFADIVGFIELSSHTSPPTLVELLN
ncbi:adenylate/guanylate cyclase domain-containing protein [Trichormus azollae]|nr:adenylate/guanylate cyclase domain-containing protein [Trichormus azollae]